jgi:hypothetical protein
MELVIPPLLSPTKSKDEQLAEDCLQSIFVFGVVDNLIKVLHLEHLQPKNDARNDAVLAVKRLLDVTLEQVDRN